MCSDLSTKAATQQPAPLSVPTLASVWQQSLSVERVQKREGIFSWSTFSWEERKTEQKVTKAALPRTAASYISLLPSNSSIKLPLILISCIYFALTTNSLCESILLFQDESRERKKNMMAFLPAKSQTTDSYSFTFLLQFQLLSPLDIKRRKCIFADTVSANKLFLYRQIPYISILIKLLKLWK